MFVSNTENAAVAAAHSENPDRWWTGFGEVRDRIAARFTRHEPRRHAASLMLGLADLDARTAGRSPNTAVIEPRTGCSICCLGRSGTSTVSGTTCAATSPTTWAIPMQSWSLTYAEPGTMPTVVSCMVGICSRGELVVGPRVG